MKTYKSIDFFAQIGLLAMTILAFIIDNYETLNPMLFIMGIAVVQIISILTHSMAGHQALEKESLEKVSSHRHSPGVCITYCCFGTGFFGKIRRQR